MVAVYCSKKAVYHLQNKAIYHQLQHQPIQIKKLNIYILNFILKLFETMFSLTNILVVILTTFHDKDMDKY